LLVQADGHFFLAPDNGLLSWVLKQAKQVRLRKLRNEVHRPGELSSTFHGRDVFAYAAGLLAAGRSKPEDISNETNSVIMPSWAVVQIEENRIVGEIVHIDRFGNLITNITKRQVEEAGWTSCLVQAGLSAHIRLCRTYGDSESGELFALCGSSRTLELAVSNGSAQKKSDLTRGAAVIVRQARS
jgi:S-adenosylmethionine hydrolase